MGPPGNPLILVGVGGIHPITPATPTQNHPIGGLRLREFMLGVMSNPVLNTSSADLSDMSDPSLAGPNAFAVFPLKQSREKECWGFILRL